MNADLTDRSSMFAKHMLHFRLSSQLLLLMDRSTYISEAWHTTLWLDHCISIADAHSTLQSMETLYEASASDHVPFVMTVDMESLPEMNSELKRAGSVKLD